VEEKRAWGEKKRVCKLVMPNGVGTLEQREWRSLQAREQIIASWKTWPESEIVARGVSSFQNLAVKMRVE
jgi:hypothetical protein